MWRGGVRVDSFGVDGIPVYGGEVDVDPTKQVRRTLSGVKVDGTDEMWDLLSPVGTELRVFRGFRFLNGEYEFVPVGVFVTPGLRETYGGDWSGQIGTAPDRMFKVQQARFTSPRAILPNIPIVSAIQVLLEEVLGPVSILSTNRTPTGSGLVFERDRGKAISDLAASIGVDVFCAPDGTPTIRDTPQLADPSWTVDAGEQGVLYEAGRERSYERTYSGVVVVPDAVDGTLPFDPVTLWDEDPDSPTYHLGPFGEVPYFMASPLITTRDQAYVAAQARLPRVTAARAQLSLTSECNPALSDGDTIKVVLPPRQRGSVGIVENHLVGAFTIPLTPDGTQSIETASATADVEDSA